MPEPIIKMTGGVIRQQKNAILKNVNIEIDIFKINIKNVEDQIKKAPARAGAGAGGVKWRV